MQIQPPFALTLALLLPLAACGGSKDSRSLISAGNTALNSGDHAAAVASFDAALKGLKPDEMALQRDALLGKCEALAYVDSEKAKNEFLRLAESESLSYSDYNRIAVALTSASKFGAAVALLEQGMAKYPTEAKFAQLVNKVGKAAESAGDSEAMSKLKGLGYVGN